MALQRVDTWYRGAAGLYHPGRPVRAPGSGGGLTTDPFILRTHMATLDRTGPYWGAVNSLTDSTVADRDPDEPLTKWTGGASMSTASNGEEFHFVDFGETILNFTGQNQRLYGCKALNLTRGPASTGTSGAVNCFGATQKGLRIEFCSFENRAYNYAINGVVGHDFTVRRSSFLGYVDNLNIQNNNGDEYVKSGPVNVLSYGSYYGPLAFYWADTKGVVHPSDFISHMDSWQITGGSNAVSIGDTFASYPHPTVGYFGPNRPGWTEGYVWPDPRSQAGMSLSSLTETANVGSPSGIVVEDGRFFGGVFGLNFGSPPKAGTYPDGTAFSRDLGRALRCTFDRTQGQQFTGGDATATIMLDAAWTFDTGTGNDRNFYMDPNDPECGPDYAHPVTVRRNA